MHSSLFLLHEINKFELASFQVVYLADWAFPARLVSQRGTYHAQYGPYQNLRVNILSFAYLCPGLSFQFQWLCFHWKGIDFVVALNNLNWKQDYKQLKCISPQAQTKWHKCNNTRVQTSKPLELFLIVLLPLQILRKIKINLSSNFIA